MSVLRRVMTVLACAATLPTIAARVADAQQQMAYGDRGPRFLAFVDGGVKPLDVQRTAVLNQRLALDLDGVTIKAALEDIIARSGLRLVYRDALLPADTRVHLRASEITVAAALAAVLLDAGVDVGFDRSGGAVLVKRPPPAQNGSVSGRVSDAQTSAAIGGATVVLEGTSRSTTTDNDGRYRIADLAPGTYTLRARYIGYAPGLVSVKVSADQETTADVALEKSVQRLDEVVTTGTILPTELKALPTPVSVITAADIALQQPQTVQDVFRQGVPTAVSWDQAPSPYLTSFSVRGASSLSPGSGQMKVFVDGVEMALGNRATVDPNSIERIEVVRGPQAAAIYGSDAIGGVIQIFTKRGHPGLTRPEVELQGAAGVIQTPYQGKGSVLRQNYTGSVRGGTSVASYNFGAGYSHTGDYLPNGELSRQSNPSLYGGIRYADGLFTADVSGRYTTSNAPNVFNPALVQSGFVAFAAPNFLRAQVQNQSVGGRLTLTPTRWWQSTLWAGLDHTSDELEQTQPRRTTPADTLLQVFKQSRSKAAIGFSTALHGSVGPAMSGSLTLGFDHYSLPLDQFFTFGALRTTGSIQTAGQPISASRTVTNNTGYFTQVQLGFRDALFVTAGLRAEENTNFGIALGTPFSPRAGLSYAQQVGGVALKFRGSYGRAIQAPSPGRKLAAATPTSVTLENLDLGPERQRGWDTGVDVVFGRLTSLSVTYYNQIADDLIQQVLLQSQPVPTFQWQNIGRVKNTGIELEGTLTAGSFRLKGQYGYARSRVDQLAPNYTGDLRVGDQSLATPKHTAGASLSVAVLEGTTVSGGLVYVGEWRQYDFLQEFRCFGGTGPCQPTFRDYIVEYPDFAKVNLSLTQQITPNVVSFVAVDNVTNNESYEFFNFNPVMGRLTTVGVRLRY